MIKLPISEYSTKAAFCRAIGISPQFLTQIEKELRPIPPKAAIALNRIHGIPLHDIRPDIYPGGQNPAVNIDAPGLAIGGAG
jgi:DNA-binding transcriptional regulator YdaS (Cro superfamily)